MQFFRQYIAPLFVVLLFAVALLAVSVRIFLPEDMAAPAPIEPTEQLGTAPLGDHREVANGELANNVLNLDQLVRGVPLDLDLEAAL
jgi:hypothetical protein